MSEQSSELNFANIFLAELGRLKRIVAGMGLDVSDSEDVLQDVSIQALKQFRKYRTREECVRWLIKVTVNRCLMEHRRRRSFRRQASEILKRRLETNTCLLSPDSKIIHSEELEIVRKSLQELEGSLLMVMVLRYFCGLNSTEMGEILDVSPSTIRSRLREARLILAGKLVERGIEP
jgi:RNA polymerase sigma-70 factor (ECF subfamily)